MTERLMRLDNPEQTALFAEYQSARASLKPAECDASVPCWVRDGPPATGSQHNKCTGCGGRIKGRTMPRSRVVAAIRPAPRAKPAKDRAPLAPPLIFNGQEYSSRKALARHLATVTGRSVKACETMLMKHGDDGARVLSQYQKDRGNAAVPAAIVDALMRIDKELDQIRQCLSELCARG